MRSTEVGIQDFPGHASRPEGLSPGARPAISRDNIADVISQEVESLLRLFWQAYLDLDCPILRRDVRIRRPVVAGKASGLRRVLAHRIIPSGLGAD